MATAAIQTDQLHRSLRELIRVQSASVERIFIALCDLDDSHIFEPPQRKRIRTANIMARLMHANRYHDSLKRYHRNEAPAPIRVVEAVLWGESYYMIEDGNARVMAARKMGIAEMMADISCRYDLRPDLHLLDPVTHVLWRRETQTRHKQYTQVLIMREEECSLLLQIGVGEFNPQ